MGIRINSSTTPVAAPGSPAASNAAVVHLAGAETITGAKSMASVGLNGNAPVAKAGAITSPANASAAVATTASTSVAPFGYTTAAQADSLVTQINNLVTAVANMKVAIDAIRVDIQALGITA